MNASKFVQFNILLNRPQNSSSHQFLGDDKMEPIHSVTYFGQFRCLMLRVSMVFENLEITLNFKSVISKPEKLLK